MTAASHSVVSMQISSNSQYIQAPNIESINPKNEPIYIVDGVAIKADQMAKINPNDIDDVKGLLSDRYEVSKDRLENALETVIALCEPVHPQDEPSFIRYFCGNTEIPNDLKDTEERRVTLYKAVVALIRAYANIANEMHKIGYSEAEAEKIKKQVQFYSDLRETIKQASGDYVDLKRFEPGMRQLMDMYIDAKSSQKISDFENQRLYPSEVIVY